MSKLSKTLHKNFIKAKLFCGAHSAEICTGVAMATGALAFGMAIKATNDIQDDMAHHKKNIEDIKDRYNKDDEIYYCCRVTDEGDEVPATELTGDAAKKEYRKNLTGEYARTTLTVAKHYAVPVALEITSIGTIFASNKISRRKNASLAASLTAVQAMYDKYRQGVIERYGEDEDRNIMYGLHKEKVTVTTEEDGKKKKTKEEVEVMDKDKVVNPFVLLFNEDSCHFSPSRGQNADFLNLMQSQCEDKLYRDGFLYVNDVLKMLGLEKYCSEIGQTYGWLYDEDKACQIDFHQSTIHETVRIEALRRGEPVEPTIWITLTPDGYIADKAWTCMSK